MIYDVDYSDYEIIRNEHNSSVEINKFYIEEDKKLKNLNLENENTDIFKNIYNIIEEENSSTYSNISEDINDDFQKNKLLFKIVLQELIFDKEKKFLINENNKLKYKNILTELDFKFKIKKYEFGFHMWDEFTKQFLN